MTKFDLTVTLSAYEQLKATKTKFPVISSKQFKLQPGSPCFKVDDDDLWSSSSAAHAKFKRNQTFPRERRSQSLRDATTMITCSRLKHRIFICPFKEAVNIVQTTSSSSSIGSVESGIIAFMSLR
jgi:hypothetical protein